MKAEPVDHGGDGVQGVVVTRTTEIREAAGHGETTFVVGIDPECVDPEFDRAGEAGVKVEGAHVVDAHTGCRQGGGR